MTPAVPWRFITVNISKRTRFVRDKRLLLVKNNAIRFFCNVPSKYDIVVKNVPLPRNGNVTVFASRIILLITDETYRFTI